MFAGLPNQSPLLTMPGQAPFSFAVLCIIMPLRLLEKHCKSKVKCLVHEHNTMSPTRAQTRNGPSGDESTNHVLFPYLWFAATSVPAHACPQPRSQGLRGAGTERGETLGTRLACPWGTHARQLLWIEQLPENKTIALVKTLYSTFKSPIFS